MVQKVDIGRPFCNRDCVSDPFPMPDVNGRNQKALEEKGINPRAFEKYLIRKYGDVSMVSLLWHPLCDSLFSLTWGGMRTPPQEHSTTTLQLEMRDSQLELIDIQLEVGDLWLEMKPLTEGERPSIGDERPLIGGVGTMIESERHLIGGGRPLIRGGQLQLEVRDL